MSIPSPRLRCGPAELRLLTPRAAQQLFTLAREAEVSAMLQWPAHESIEDSLSYIHDTRALWQRGRAWLPGIFDHERGQLVGCTGIMNIDRPNRRAEVGTWLGLPFQGQGFYRPARAALATFAFEQLELERLEFLVRVDNPRSLAAIRALPGIREECVLAARIWRDDVGHDAVMFAMLANEFDRSDWPDVFMDPPTHERAR
ncbi:MAG: GNAT family protein [Gaiellales bacterium]